MRSSPGTDTGPAEQGEDLRAELEHARAQLAESEDRHLRARADLENYRKRAGRELERRVEERGDRLLSEWLEVVDSVERALAVEAEHGEVVAGLRAVLDQIDAILARQGVRRLGAVGDAFDPERHEAISVVPASETEAGTIVNVARSGYAAGDRVIRPAQVVVAH